MPTSLTRFKKEFSRVWPLLGRINWRDQAFTPEKAYVTAVFSKVAYLEIPAFELPYYTLAKVIPCLTYQELIARGTRLDIREFLRSVEFGNAFVVTTRYVVAVGVIRSDVIILALRGTRPLYFSDWMIDLHAKRIVTHVNTHQVKLHSGFYLAITDCLEQIATEIQNRIGGGAAIPVYVVGHSLGGALAAIAYAVAGTTFYTSDRYGLRLTARINAHSSFSFGMPRYGDGRAIINLRSPFHTYNDMDVVPGVPPRWIGYENVPIEYRAAKGGLLIMMPQDRNGLGWWLSRANFARGVRYHLIERYIRRLGVMAGVY